MNEANMIDRLDGIERRLARVEQVLGFVLKGPAVDERGAEISPARTWGQAATAKPVSAEPIAVEPLLAEPLSAEFAQVNEVPAGHAVPPPLPMDAPPISPPAFAEAYVPDLQQAPAVEQVIPYQPAPVQAKRPPVQQRALEQTIGLKWTGWIGAIVLVIGAGFGIKFAYDNNLIHASPVARMSMLCVFGFVLIAAGEWVYRRINALSATGLFGAGVAVLFLVSYAGHGYYGLYKQNTAFLFMAMSTLVGAAVAMRGNLVSIAVLSLIGGNLAPVLLHGDQPHVGGFLGYLLMLQGVALVLAWWGGSRKWWTLRGLSFAGTALWVAVTIGLNVPESTGMIVSFMLIFAGLYQVELILSALRKKRMLPANYFSDGKTGLNFSLLVTTALTIGVLYLFRDSSELLQTSWVLSLAGITALLGLVLTRETGEPITLDYLAAGYTIQAAALLALAVPVALSGAWIAAGWGILALAFGLMGMVMDLPVARYSAAVTWLLAMGELLIWTQGWQGRASGHVADVWLTLAGHDVPAYAIMSWLLVIGGHAVAYLVARPGRNAEQTARFREVAVTVSGAASVVWLVATLAALPPLWATLWLVAYAWLLAGTDIFAQELGLLPHVLAILGVATIKWIVIDTLAARLAPGWTPGADWPIVNPLMGTGALIAGSILGMYRLRRDRVRNLLRQRRDAGDGRVLLLAVIALLLTFAFSVDIERIVERSVRAGAALSWPGWQLKQMAWTMLWTLAASAFAAAVTKMEGREQRRRWWLGRIRSLVVALAVKYFFVDTLLYRVMDGPAPAAAVFNLQLLAGLVVASSLLMLRFFSRSLEGFSNASSGGGADRDLSFAVSFGATAVLLWTGTMEIDRLVERFVSPGWLGFSRIEWKHFLWTSWWMLGVSAYLMGMSRSAADDPRRRAGLLNAYWKLPIALAVKYLIVDTIFFRIDDGAAFCTVLVNMQAFTAAIVLAGLVLLVYLASAGEVKELAQRSIRTAAAAMIVLVLLWAGTLEVDRAFQKMAGTFMGYALAEQVALSIFWSLFAICAIVAGFRLRSAALRYFGLALFAVTLLKVVTVDMSQVSTGYRIMSFIGLGGLLMGTSVVYGKLTPILLKEAVSE